MLEDYTTFEVEAVGLSLVLYLLSHETDVQTATIRLDNQAVIQSLQYHKLKPSQHLINGLLLQIKEIFWCIRDPDCGLEIAWIKGHKEIVGNELVD